MLRYAFRRLLWTLPTLLVVSLVSFLFLSYVPDITDDPSAIATLTPAQIVHLRREKFLDLPRFVNLAPKGVGERADAALAAIAAGGKGVADAERDLARLGGAALPFVLPKLDTLAPEPRAKVAIALAPVAKRMGVDHAGEASNPKLAAAFWSRFWDNRHVDFRRAAVRSAVARLVRYGTKSRATDLIELDTFALDDVIGALELPSDSGSIDRAAALIEVAAHATGNDDRITAGDDLAAARACVDRWRTFWSVYRSDFVAHTGMARVAAIVLETRYGKWVLSVVTARFGQRAGSYAVIEEVGIRAPVTLGLVFGAIALAYVVGGALGVLSAIVKKQRYDGTLAVSVLVLYAIPTPVAAVVVHGAAGVSYRSAALALVVLALALVAAPVRHQRAALAEVLSRDYIRAAEARGAGRVRVVVVHALRNAALPLATLATLEAPMALGGAFVVEHVFGLRGMGEATMIAVTQRDTSWLMVVSIGAAALAALLVVITDLGYVAVNPLLRTSIVGRRRRS